MAINFNKAEFVLSAVKASTFIRDGKPQVTFAGRSNVGKSSVINRLLGRKNFARVGATPGKTNQINYFDIDGKVYFTDLPGYGFARVSREEKQKWALLIDDYLLNEEMLCHVLFLVDIRHEPTADDAEMYNFLVRRNLPFTVVATKSDKLPKSQIKNRIRHLAAVFKLGEADILPVSGLLKTGKEAVLDKIERIIYTETP